MNVERRLLLAPCLLALPALLALLPSCLGEEEPPPAPTDSEPLPAGAICWAGGPACQEGLRCVDSRCTAIAGLGEPCGGGEEIASAATRCADGLFCDEMFFRCVALVGEGERCSELLHLRCAEGLVCLAERCAALPGPGEPCTGSSPAACATGLLCLQGRCSYPAGPGEPCDEAAHRRCTEGSACRDGVCAEDGVSPAGPGEACGPDAEGRECADGLDCLDGFCRTLLGPGGDCRDVETT
ncbi:MAG: hypothetical protein FJ125_05910, partial [Deltaproteobacteria bacterium]|nr:hypothetical protein [Deltaproteobacteria bacterium]